jgi:hypothetical protein
MLPVHETEVIPHGLILTFSDRLWISAWVSEAIHTVSCRGMPIKVTALRTT